MKATELMSYLADLISRHGDLEVFSTEPDNWGNSLDEPLERIPQFGYFYNGGVFDTLVEAEFEKEEAEYDGIDDEQIIEIFYI